jgi:putative ABC transport system permease protein
MNKLSNWIRVALTDLRGDLRRFGILIACLALGIGTIAGVSSVGAALQRAVIENADVLLGGDLRVSRADRRADPDELTYLKSLGQVSETIVSSANGRAMDDSGNSVLLDLYAVDSNYPLLGHVVSPQLPAGDKPQDLLAEKDGVYGAIIDPVILDRLGIDLGGHFSVNGTEFEVRGLLTSIPDGALRPFHLGLTAVVSIAGAQANPNTRPPLPGLLTSYNYKILLAQGDYRTAQPLVKQHFAADPEWKVESPYDAAGELTRFYNLFVNFLLVVGLSSLLVGGLGISNSVSAYIQERQRAIATLRSLGATGARILVHFFTQVGLLSLVGIAIGLGIGAALTAAALPVLGGILGIEMGPSIEVPSLLTALGFGVLAAFAFSYLPLVKAQKLRPAILFRTVGTSIQNLQTRDYFDPLLFVPLLLAGAGIFALAWATTHNIYLVLYYALGVIAAFVLMRLGAILLQWVLRALPAAPNRDVRSAFRSIYRPGSPAPVVIMSLGLGLAMLLVITILSSNVSNQLMGQVQKDAPTLVATDLFDDEVVGIQQFLEPTGLITNYQHSPMIRATVSKVNGVPSSELRDKPGLAGEAAYMIGKAEILMTWSSALPENSTVTAGQWWARDYDGPPLVSLRDEDAQSLGLKPGDTIELSLFGETLEAKVANLRDFQFQNGLNFLVTASPGTFADFPGTNLVTIKAVEGKEKDLERALARQYPDLTFLPVGELLDQAAGILTKLANAVNIVGALAVVNGLLVLAGTMAAGRKQREADAVVNKVLGATRRDVVRVFALEYALLGAFSALLATCVGIAGAFGIAKVIQMDVGFSVDMVLVVSILVGSVVLTIITGALTTWSALSTRPAQYLRAMG